MFVQQGLEQLKLGQQQLQQFGNLSPFTLQANTQLQASPKAPHQGVHGVFGDCLPDGWGMLLQDRIFRQKGILPNQLTAMDRLAFVGDKGMGALSFSPVSEFSATTHADIDLATLGLEAQTLFDSSMSDYMDDNHDELDGHTQQVLAALVAGGSSGGARPKAQIYMPAGETQYCRTFAQLGDEAWLIKFTSKNLALGHEEGRVEHDEEEERADHVDRHDGGIDPEGGNDAHVHRGLDQLRADDCRCEAAGHHVRDRLGPERLRGGVGGGKAIKAVRAHVDAGQKAAEQEDGEGGQVKTHRPHDAAKRAAGDADEEPGAAAPALHDGRERRCRQHRAENDHRDRHGGKADIAGQRLPGQPADGEDHRHLRAQEGLGKHQNPDIASGAAVVGWRDRVIGGG